MARTSPLTVTYKTLQTLAEEVLKESEARYAEGQRRVSSSLEPLKARVENAKVWVKMLKRCEAGKQADLFALYNEVNR